LIEDHFDVAFELFDTLRRKELFDTLRRKGRTAELTEMMAWLPEPGAVHATRQQELLGAGHAVWCARHMVGDAPFAVLLADDVILGEPGCIGELVKAHHQTGGNIVAIAEVPAEQVNRYGV
jgi:UTP-glucose-1-phosphate uridylyltransferase